jgi:hypothetical protein
MKMGDARQKTYTSRPKSLEKLIPRTLEQVSRTGDPNQKLGKSDHSSWNGAVYQFTPGAICSGANIFFGDQMGGRRNPPYDGKAENSTSEKQDRQ